ncbi:uncharacterized protein LOC119745929 [Patiria miniata]|uniref:Uncharacterized protein n=1 Tax=Patiria miniata TaxID=46514 RepID=A0A914BSN7_PATMI|nr:uncharacterized protein LOC119745929 [Patiria miniata]XP_038078538.1 uncharacterized protein LOC119745929 [Patiria miniata]
METGSWVGVAIFCSIAIILLILLIARTVYRAWHYHNCCSWCRNINQGGDSKQKKTEGIAKELQAINDKQRAEQEAARDSLGRTNSQTFDPLNPDSLELPIHGIHYPDPGEEIEEEDTPPGGHNDDFRIVNVGVGEPNKTPAVSERKQDAIPDQESVENKEHKSESSHHSVPEAENSRPDTPTKENGECQHIQTNGGVPSESHSKDDAILNQETGEFTETKSNGDVTRAESNQLDTPTKEDKGSPEKLMNGGVPDPESYSEEDAMPPQDSGENPKLVEDTTQAHGKDELVAKETPDKETGIENPMGVDDSELRPIYV